MNGHEHVGDAEVGVAVEQDRTDVHADEHDRQRAEVAVEAQQPRRCRPATEHLGGEQQAPDDGGEDQRPGDDAAGPGDVPRDLVHRSAPARGGVRGGAGRRGAEDVLDARRRGRAGAARGAGRWSPSSDRRVVDAWRCSSRRCAVGASWSRPGRRARRSTPPSESIAATLSAVAALRARARAGPARGRWRAGADVWWTVGSSMTVTVRTGGE